MNHPLAIVRVAVQWFPCLRYVFRIPQPNYSTAVCLLYSVAWGAIVLIFFRFTSAVQYVAQLGEIVIFNHTLRSFNCEAERVLH